MSGFSIFMGESLDRKTLKKKLENFLEIKEIEGTELKDNIERFEVKSNGTICFDYKWDRRIPLTFRGETRFGEITSALHVRIVPYKNTLFYLIEKKRDTEIKYVVEKLSQILYENQYMISKIPLTSEIIKEIEDRDSRELRGEALEGLSDRDKSMLLYGTLEIKSDDGTTSPSMMHEMYRGNPKHYSNFVSFSYGTSVYISGKKGKNKSVTLRGMDFNTVESYIRDFILPRLHLED